VNRRRAANRAVNRRRAANRAANRPANRPANQAANRHRAVAGAAAVTGIVAALVAGYAAAGATGLIDVASVATLGVLIAARAMLRREKPRPVRPEKRRRDPVRRPAVRAADFPAYATVASDLEWARMSRRHYEHALRPRLARLAATLGKHDTVVIPSLTGPGDADGPGVDLATLERVITQLEGP
jgi:hypothetical protein